MNLATDTDSMLDTPTAPDFLYLLDSTVVSTILRAKPPTFRIRHFQSLIAYFRIKDATTSSTIRSFPVGTSEWV